MGMPLGQTPFPGMPPGQGVPPGMPRLPFGMPGLPIPGMIPPGMNPQGLPGMQLPPGMGNMPFQRMPMNNRMPFMPGVNPFMMAGLMQGMQQGAPMPGMPPFFRGLPPMAGQPPANAPADAGQPQQDGNQGNVAVPPNEENQEGKTESSVLAGENVLPGQGPPVDQEQNGQELKGPEQFGGPNMGPGQPNMGPGQPNMGPGQPNMGPGQPNMGPGQPNMGPGGGPPFQGGPSFPGRPPFQPQFGPQGQQPPFHGDPRFQGPRPFHEQGGPQGPWGHQGGPDNQWRHENRPWGRDEGPPNDNWGNEEEYWGHEDDHWGHEDRHWGRGNDRRGRRDRRSQDDWGHEEQFDRRKRGRFDNDWDRHQGPHRDRHQGPHRDRHHGPPFDHHEGPPFGRDHPPRFGPPGRGPPFPMDGPRPFDDRPPWMREEQRRGRWGDEEGQFGGNPMEQQQGFDAEQQEFVEQPDPNAPWHGHQGDGHDRPRDMPSLMNNQFKPDPEVPGGDSGVPNEEIQKGWAEINELKAKLAMNKSQGATSAGVTASEQVEGAPVEQGVTEEQPIVVKQEVDIAAVPSEGERMQQAAVPNEQVVQEIAPVSEMEVPSEQAAVPGETNVDPSVTVQNIKKEDEGMTGDTNFNKTPRDISAVVPEQPATDLGESAATDTVVEKPLGEGSGPASETCTSQEGTNLSEASIQAEESKAEGFVIALSDDVENKLLPAVQSDAQMPLDENKESEEARLGSIEVNIGTAKVSIGSDTVTMGSESDKASCDEVKMRSDEVTGGSKETDVASTEVRMESEHFTMGSEEVNVESGVNLISDEVKVGSLEANECPVQTTIAAIVEPDPTGATTQLNTTAESLGLAPEEVKCFPVENQTPAVNIEETSRSNESATNECEAIGKTTEKTEIGQVPEQIGGGSMRETVSEGSERIDSEQLNEKTESEATVKHELDVSSEANKQVGEVLLNAEHDNASADAIDRQEVTDDA